MNSATWQRVLQFERVNNFRDYGGWRGQDGARVKTGALYRSAHLARATDADVARLSDLGIQTVIDLRHPSEQNLQPSAWIGKLDLAVIEAPEDPNAVAAHEDEAPHVVAFRGSDFSADAMLAFLTHHYGEMPYDPRHVSLYSRYFDVLADGEGSVLIHCAAGKDRTGILARLTHHVLGVHPDDAMHDYLLSNEAGNIEERLPHVKRQMETTYNREITNEAMQSLLTVNEGYINFCWKTLGEKSGSVDGYLANVLRVSPEKRQRIQERLLS